MVTVVTEGIFSYCGRQGEDRHDRYLGPEQAVVRVRGEAIGHVTTAEYGSQMLSLGGVHHLTGGSKKEGVVTCDALLALCNKEAVELSVDGGSTVFVQADRRRSSTARARSACGWAAARGDRHVRAQWKDHVDEVIVSTIHHGVLSEHQGGRFLDMKPAGIPRAGRKSTPGRYFQVAGPGLGWGGTDVSDPLAIIEKIDPKQAWPGLRLPDGLDHRRAFGLVRARPGPSSRSPRDAFAGAPRRGAHCRELRARALHRVVHGGAGARCAPASQENPVRLTRSVREALTKVTLAASPPTSGRAAHHLDGRCCPHAGEILRLCGPTPALVAPIEFTLRADDYAALVATPRAHHAGRRAARQQGAGRQIDRRLSPRWSPAPAARADRPHHRGLRRAAPRSSAPTARRSTASAISCRCWSRAVDAAAPVRAAYPLVQGPVARRMAEAVWPYAASTSRPWRRSRDLSPTRCWRRCF